MELIIDTRGVLVVVIAQCLPTDYNNILTLFSDVFTKLFVVVCCVTDLTQKY